jgi:dolichol-phosphate mannosyltransferase
MSEPREQEPSVPTPPVVERGETRLDRLADTRAGRALRRPHNWVELAKFCTVGASGYVVNLTVYTLLLELADFHYLLAAVCSFLVAVTNNYTWNRLWTFRHQRGNVAYQGVRFLVVSVLALSANLVVLEALVSLDVGEVLAQAIAIIVVTPLNFIGNKVWSFRHAPLVRPFLRRLVRRSGGPG